MLGGIREYINYYDYEFFTFGTYKQTHRLYEPPVDAPQIVCQLAPNNSNLLFINNQSAFCYQIVPVINASHIIRTALMVSEICINNQDRTGQNSRHTHFPAV